MNSFSAVMLTVGRCWILRTRRDYLGRQRASLAHTARVAVTVMFLGIAVALTSGNALAQQTAATPTPAPRNPNWCSDVPASPAPPHFENAPGEWTAVRNMCMNAVGVTSATSTCMYACRAAREMWQRAKTGGLNQPLTFPPSTDKPQGPFLEPDGGKIYVLPLPPTPAASTTPADPESFAVPAASTSPGPAPTGSFSGADTSATSDGEPPDVAADVSATQNVEFVNGGSGVTNGGLYVFDKTGTRQNSLPPVRSGAAQTAPTEAPL
jgi:hypothetical protein